VLVNDSTFENLNSSEVFHIKTADKNKAVECVKEILETDYSFDKEIIEEELDIDVFELDDNNIIDID